MYDISADDLTEAAIGHIDRTQLFGPQPIQRILVELGADPEEVQACFHELGRQREVPGDEGDGYYAGCLDGFILGVRAARAAAGRVRA